MLTAMIIHLFILSSAVQTWYEFSHICFQYVDPILDMHSTSVLISSHAREKLVHVKVLCYFDPILLHRHAEHRGKTLATRHFTVKNTILDDRLETVGEG